MPRDDYPITADILIQAYRMGIFPMSESRHDPDLFWVDPRRRGILPLSEFHISRSLARRMRKRAYHVTLNADFDGVLSGCAGRDETWINDTIRGLYLDLHDRGQAHSVEIWHDTQLVGGVYGVSIGAAFFGESMFSHATDTSKLALAHLTDHLIRCRFSLFDTQFVTDHLLRLGAVEIPRGKYHSLLAEAIDRPVCLTDVNFDPDPQSVLQRRTQTS